MQNKINKIKHTGVYVLVVDDYLYKTGDIFGEWIFLPMDSPAISKYDDTYVIIKYDLMSFPNIFPFKVHLRMPLFLLKWKGNLKTDWMRSKKTIRSKN